MEKETSVAAILAVMIFAGSGFCQGQADPPAVDPSQFYRQRGTDSSFASLMKKKQLNAGSISTAVVKGSRVKINHVLLKGVPTAGQRIPRDIRLHTLGNSVVPRKHFDRWSRWYQEDGNTQIFRLFKGEHNVRNGRKNAARVETFGGRIQGKGAWHQWQGTYTIIKPHGCSIFQSKNQINAWAVMINMGDNGDIKLNHRRQKDRIIARNMTGKSFHLRVLDNGYDYRVFFNGRQVGEGYYARPKSHTTFRWGMYLGDNEVRHDAMILVTGAQFGVVKAKTSD